MVQYKMQGKCGLEFRGVPVVTLSRPAGNGRKWVG